MEILSYNEADSWLCAIEQASSFDPITKSVRDAFTWMDRNDPIFIELGKAYLRLHDRYMQLNDTWLKSEPSGYYARTARIYLACAIFLQLFSGTKD